MQAAWSPTSGHWFSDAAIFEQVDATTQLSDGLKVDFSWDWTLSPLGIAAGLSGERQRGVAYFTRTENGLTIDKIEMK